MFTFGRWCFRPKVDVHFRTLVFPAESRFSLSDDGFGSPKKAGTASPPSRALNPEVLSALDHCGPRGKKKRDFRPTQRKVQTSFAPIHLTSRSETSFAWTRFELNRGPSPPIQLETATKTPSSMVTSRCCVSLALSAPRRRAAPNLGANSKRPKVGFHFRP